MPAYLFTSQQLEEGPGAQQNLECKGGAQSELRLDSWLDPAPPVFPAITTALEVKASSYEAGSRVTLESFWIQVSFEPAGSSFTVNLCTHQ